MKVALIGAGQIARQHLACLKTLPGVELAAVCDLSAATAEATAERYGIGAWVAAGRYDGFWESNLQPWDTAAGCLLVREASGFVTDWRGRSDPICNAQVLAGNDALHSRLHKLLVGALKADR